MTSYVIACAGWTHCLVDDKGVSYPNDTFLWVNERYEKKPVSSAKIPHSTSNPCYFKGVFIIYPFGGGGEENFEVLPCGGGVIRVSI